MFILSPKLEGETLEKEIDFVKNEVVKQFGEISEAKQLGKRQLAYSIKKMREGFYLLLNFTIKSELISKLLKRIRLNTNILRAQIFCKEKFSINEIRE